MAKGSGEPVRVEQQPGNHGEGGCRDFDAARPPHRFDCPVGKGHCPLIANGDCHVPGGEKLVFRKTRP
jgi:hypothetical protein